MFTGIVEEVGQVAQVQAKGQEMALQISCSHVLEGVATGDSIAVNGCCLTVASFNQQGFTAFLSKETLDRTGFKGVTTGWKVNLERAMAAAGRFGGHIMQGHVDGLATLKSLTRVGEGYDLDVALPPEMYKFQVEKGSIALDGISLTVAKMLPGVIRVALIPHTLENTHLHSKKPGDAINVEVDILAKYVYHFASGIRENSSPGTSPLVDRLKDSGFMT